MRKDRGLALRPLGQQVKQVPGTAGQAKQPGLVLQRLAQAAQQAARPSRPTRGLSGAT